jgi:hypothetical protein
MHQNISILAHELELFLLATSFVSMSILYLPARGVPRAVPLSHDCYIEFLGEVARRGK